MRRLNRKAKFLLVKLKKALALAKRLGEKEEVKKLEDEVNNFLNPRAKFFKLQKKKKFKKKLVIPPGTDPKIIARKLNGAKGGNKTAALYSYEKRKEWTTKAGNSTLQKYGRDFYKHIQKIGVKNRRKRNKK